MTIGCSPLTKLLKCSCQHVTKAVVSAQGTTGRRAHLANDGTAAPIHRELEPSGTMRKR